MDDAGATLAGIAADMRAGQPEMVPQQMDQQRPALDISRRRFAVHPQFACRHASFLPTDPNYAN